MRKLKYAYNCVNPNDLVELNYIIDNHEEIEREDFEEIIDLNDLKELEILLGYSDSWQWMKDDWHVSYNRSLYNNELIVFFRHSGIEYVFK